MHKQKIILLHGKDTDPTQKWYLWLKNELAKRGITCLVPELPKAADPVLDEWLAEITKLNPDAETTLIGHSRGGMAILRWLEQQPQGVRVKKVILVAANNPAILEKQEIADTHGFYEKGPYDYAKIKQHCNDFVVLHSKDDQWVSYEAGEANAQGLGAKLLSFENKGHFGSTMKKQEISELLEGVLITDL